jgi:thymidylate synthase (FAD)
MKIVKPSVEVFFHYPHTAEGEVIQPQVFLERVGRTCYKSEDKISQDSAGKFIKMLNDRGHHAMLEHCTVSVKFITERGVTHELCRHRIMSPAQESTRYCSYNKDKFGNEISVVEPPGLAGDVRHEWEQSCLVAEGSYMRMLGGGVAPQIARSVLPTCLKAEIWATANFREWHHIFTLRCSPQAHPQIREVMLMALEKFKDVVPEMFLSLWEKYGAK